MAKTIHPPVFITSAVLIILFVLAGIFFTESFTGVVDVINGSINSYLGWFLILTISILLLFVIYLGFSGFGDYRLAPDDSKPQYSFFSWIAMLFSAGMGIGLLFYGVAEPILHYSQPPVGQGGTVEAAKNAMDFTFLHWGIHAWATYIIMGLGIAYFTYRKGYPLSIRYMFYPLFKNKIYGVLGDVIDVLAVLGTMFGLATSLGLGAMQINSGLKHLFDIPVSVAVQIIIISIVSLMALASVVSGVNRGVKWLSIFNICAGGVLLMYVIFFGPTAFIFKSYLQNIGHFLQNFFHLSFWNAAYVDIDWQSKWTLFYWSWWIAWSPYVGMFIARISRGRTIREFIVGVLLVPSLLSFLWVTAFGSTSIWMDLNGNSAIVEAVRENISTALFEFLSTFPMGYIFSGLAIIVIVSFFVTSSDSGSLVIDMITAGGLPDPPKIQRIFWAILAGLVAATLLVGGGLVALQTAALSMALPFSIVMLLICYSLYRGLKNEELAGLEEVKQENKKTWKSKQKQDA